MENIIRLIGERRRTLGLSQQYLADQLDISKSQYSKLESGSINLTVERTIALANILNINPEDIMLCMFSGHITAGRDQTRQAIKMVPVTAQAGFLSGLSDVDERSFEECYLPLFNKPDLYMIMAEGNSMDPTISPGAQLIVREIREKANLRMNIPYVVVTRDGIVIKRLREATETSQFELVSDNPEYYPYHIQKDTIISVWNIEGKVTTGWSD